MALWGIDLGGTKIECVVLERPDPEAIVLRKRIPTEAKGGYAHIVDRIRLLVDMVASETGMTPKKIGIGTPGSSDPGSGLLKNSNTTVLNGQPLHAALENALGVPVVIANDANCFALAEARMGVVPEAVPEARVVFGVIMGTGVGGGIVVDGKALNGRHGIGGEWGHNFLDESGGMCYCGRVGCVERIISGKSLERYYASLADSPRDLRQIAERASQKCDVHATQTLTRLTHFFGKGIAAVINVLDPDAIILGGGVGNIPDLYTAGKNEARKYVFNKTLDTPFLRPKLGDSAGVFGAALLAADDIDE